MLLPLRLPPRRRGHAPDRPRRRGGGPLPRPLAVEHLLVGDGPAAAPRRGVRCAARRGRRRRGDRVRGRVRARAPARAHAQCSRAAAAPAQCRLHLSGCLERRRIR